jgi:hypothetical protein
MNGMNRSKNPVSAIHFSMEDRFRTMGMGAASYPLFLRGILSTRERSGEGGILEQTSDHHD